MHSNIYIYIRVHITRLRGKTKSEVDEGEERVRKAIEEVKGEELESVGENCGEEESWRGSTQRE